MQEASHEHGAARAAAQVVEHTPRRRVDLPQHLAEARELHLALPSKQRAREQSRKAIDQAIVQLVSQAGRQAGRQAGNQIKKSSRRHRYIG